MNAPTTTYAELEIGLHRAAAESYQVELRFTHPESETEVLPERGTAALDLPELLALRSQPRDYGKTLAAGLFHARNVRTLYARARTAVEVNGLFLRLRLRVDPSAPELHALRWELLTDPETGAPLATSEKTLFSRFMVSHDWRHVRLRPKAELAALVAVAAPANLDRFKLAGVDLEGEIARARESLRGIEIDVAGREQPLTLEHLVARLRQGVDVLYLVCHGALIKGVPRLYLQDEDGKVAVADGNDLAVRIAELPQPPRLVVLASCQSAGTEIGLDLEGKATAEASLAPRLAEAGVPAVLAMQGRITMETVKRAMPLFFAELLKDGQIDRAMAVARGEVRARPDSWMPALYLRLKRGRIWYVPGFAGEVNEFRKWQSIAKSVHRGQFVPVIGPDVGEHLYGTTRARARRLAEQHGFPLEPHHRFDLAKVSQYLSVRHSRNDARQAVADVLKAEIRERHADLAGEPRLFAASVKRCLREKNNPFRILADLPARIYVTASSDPVLRLALRGADRKPRPLYSQWRKTRDNHPQEPPYEGQPTSESPIVFHPFGVYKKGDSVVLTEDDFLDYLIAAVDYKLIPAVVRGTLVKSSLIFLGFPLDDLAFRVLFRLIMSLEGSAQLGEYTHVGVQVDPDEHSLADAERAREYLEGYFHPGGDAPRIDVYWGTPADFLSELRGQLDKLAKTNAEEPPAPSKEDEDDE